MKKIYVLISIPHAFLFPLFSSGLAVMLREDLVGSYSAEDISKLPATTQIFANVNVPYMFLGILFSLVSLYLSFAGFGNWSLILTGPNKYRYLGCCLINAPIPNHK